MPSSDSDDFASADEGRGSPHKRDRKKRLSSSNYSDNLESDQDTKKPQEPVSNRAAPQKDNIQKDGWDDFEIEEESKPSAIPAKEEVKKAFIVNPEVSSANQLSESQNSGWDDFDDWGDENITDAPKVQPQKQKENEPQKMQAHKVSKVSDSQLTSTTLDSQQTSTKSEGWGWGWGMDSLLSSATAGISNLTTQVSHGISTVLETGIGAPDPEELARISAKNDTKLSKNVERRNSTEAKEPSNQSTASDGAFPFGSLLSGVTKFVETTGTKVIAGGLDTLETIGKKTMEVLQDGDPGLARKRAMLGLDSDKPVLSQVLREAKSKADEEDQLREAKREAKEVHYETLFDDFEGLVHLEALEMLSKQVSMRIEERLRSADPEKRQDIKETLQQVAELCEMPEEEEGEEEEEISEGTSRPDALQERLQKATRDIGFKLQFQPLIKQYTDILTWLETNDPDRTEKAVYKKAVSCLAQTTALSVELYHKTAEMLLVKSRRSTADEADALTQMTVVLTKHISELAKQFTEKLTNHSSGDKQQINNYITNIFLEAGNSSKYIENAFQLALPIVQIGAV